MKVLMTFCVFACVCISLKSMAQVSLDGEIRPLSELRYGYSKLPVQGQNPAFFISQRTRLKVMYQKDKIRFKLTAQDARVWGDDNNLSFYEAWINYTLTKNWALKIGRQELQYDNARLIGARNRRQDGFNYDAIIAKYAKDSLYLDIGYNLNNSQANVFGNQFEDANQRFKNFTFTYLKKYYDNGFAIATMGINSGFQKENTDTIFYKQTIGTNLTYAKGDLNFGAEGYYQTGKHKDGRNVDAYLIAGKVGYKLNSKTKITLGAEFTSGHEVTNANSDYQNTLHNFDILEGARFIYWGNANIFRNLEAHTDAAGLTNYFIKVNYQATKKWNIAATYHQFFLTESVFNNTTEINKNLGGELDIITKYKIRKGTSLVIGYSLILPTTSLEYIQNIPTNEGTNGHYFWIMLNTKLKLI